MKYVGWHSSRSPDSAHASSNMARTWRSIAKQYPPRRITLSSRAWRFVYYVSKLPPVESQYKMRAQR